MAKPITASSKALKMRGYDVEAPSLKDNKSIIPEAIPDNDGGSPENQYNFLQDTALTTYNLAKTTSDIVLEALPIAETVINPIGKYSGLYEYANTLMTTDVKGSDFKKIAKNQIDNPNIVSYLEGFKEDYALNEEKVINHLNQSLGLDVINLADLESKYKGNKQVADAATAELRNLEEQYLTDNDWYEDEDFYYIKNFKDIPMGVNLAWTKHGDLQMPNYGIFKFDESGQGSMMRHSAVNLEDSWNPVTSWIGKQGFGAKPEHEYDLNLYGDPESQTAGYWGGMALTGVHGIKSLLKGGKKLKGGKSIFAPTKGKAIAGGIASVPVAGAFDVFGE
jgi:hypothetical protein